MAVVRRTVREQVYAIIKDKILRREYLQGEALNIVHLTREMNSSNTPVREALSRLESEGLVTSAVNSKFRVAAFTEKSLSDLNYSLLVLAKGALDLCVKEDRVDALVRSLRTQLQQQEALFDVVDAYEYQRITMQFDRAIVAASDNQALINVFDTLSNRFLLSIVYVHQKEKLANLEQHRQILASLEAGDYDLTRRLLETHYDKHL